MKNIKNWAIALFACLLATQSWGFQVEWDDNANIEQSADSGMLFADSARVGLLSHSFFTSGSAIAIGEHTVLVYGRFMGLDHVRGSIEEEWLSEGTYFASLNPSSGKIEYHLLIAQHASSNSNWMILESKTPIGSGNGLMLSPEDYNGIDSNAISIEGISWELDLSGDKRAVGGKTSPEFWKPYHFEAVASITDTQENGAYIVSQASDSASELMDSTYKGWPLNIEAGDFGIQRHSMALFVENPETRQREFAGVALSNGKSENVKSFEFMSVTKDLAWILETREEIEGRYKQIDAAPATKEKSIFSLLGKIAGTIKKHYSEEL